MSASSRKLLISASECMELLSIWADEDFNDFKEAFQKFNSRLSKKDRLQNRTASSLFAKNGTKRYHHKTRRVLKQFLLSRGEERFSEGLLSSDPTILFPSLRVPFERIKHVLHGDMKNFAEYVISDAKRHDRSRRVIVKVPDGMIMEDEAINNFTDTYSGKYILYRQQEMRGDFHALCREYFEIRVINSKNRKLLVKYKNIHDEIYCGGVLISANNISCLLGSPSPSCDDHASVGINLHTRFLDEKSKDHLMGMMTYSAQDDRFRACRVIVRKDDRASESEVAILNASEEATIYYPAVNNQYAQTGVQDSNFLAMQHTMAEQFFSGRNKSIYYNDAIKALEKPGRDATKVCLSILYKEIEKIIKKQS